MIGDKYHRQGFTLIELLIVAASFSVIFLVATTVYSNAFRSHRTIQSKQESSADVRYLMETIARAIRTSTINYAYTDYASGITNPLPNDALSLVASDGSTPCYYLHSNKLYFGAADCDAAHGTDITPAEIQIININFYINPLTDPYDTTATTPNMQPHVTIALESEVILRGSRTSSFQQTTVTSRVYRR